MTKILILGATGNLASRVTAALAGRPGLSLRLTSSRDEGVARLRADWPDAEVMRADWYDPDDLKAAFAGVNRVLVIPPDFTTDEAVVTPNVIAAARATPGLEHVVRLLGQAPDQDPATMDPAWIATRAGTGLHPVAKALLDRSGLPLTYVNVGAWIGFNLPWFIARDVRDRRQVRLTHDALRPWLDEADIAAAFATVLAEGPARHAGRTWLLTAPDRYRFADVARLIGAEIGQHIDFVDTGDGLRETIGDTAEAMLTYLRFEQGVWDRIPDSDDLARLIGRPPVTLAQYIRNHRAIFIATPKPVLIVGGSGVVGSATARTLRRMQPDLPIAIGGRDLEKAQRVADAIGNAVAVQVDVARPDLGLACRDGFSAIVMFLKDDTLNSLRLAQALRIPYVDISTAAFEIAPEVALYLSNPVAPVLLNGTWLAGTALLATLHHAATFARVDAVRIGAVLDEQDMGGPAAAADYERQTTTTANALILEDGRWTWVGGEQGRRNFVGRDGAENRGLAYSLLDPVYLGSALGLRAARFDLAYGLSAGRRAGGAFSTEMVIEIDGVRQDGRSGSFRLELSHPQGQAPVTAVGVAVAVERMLGLAGGAPPAAGLHLPGTLIDPAYMVDRLRRFGTTINQG